MLVRVCDEPTPDGIFEDVSSNRRRIIGVTKHPLVVALLPECLPESSRIESARTLFCEFRKPAKVRGVSHSFDEQVHVVRHEAVSKNCETFVECGRGDLRTCEFNDRAVREHVASLGATKRQEIASPADVREVLESSRACRHRQRDRQGAFRDTSRVTASLQSETRTAITSGRVYKARPALQVW